MSIVSVHGPNMWGGTGASGEGSGPVINAPQVQATADMSNGLKFAFEATDKTRAAADYDWAFPGAATVDGVAATTKADSKGPIIVVYAAAGDKTATLTVAAGAGPPAGGAYPIDVEARAAGPRTLVADEGGDDEVVDLENATVEPDGEGEPETPTEYVIGDDTIVEVLNHLSDHPSDLASVLEQERAGKNRSTLIAQLEELQEGGS